MYAKNLDISEHNVHNTKKYPNRRFLHEILMSYKGKQKLYKFSSDSCYRKTSVKERNTKKIKEEHESQVQVKTLRPSQRKIVLDTYLRINHFKT